jgi:hypothetical protein
MMMTGGLTVADQEQLAGVRVVLDKLVRDRLEQRTVRAGVVQKTTELSSLNTQLVNSLKELDSLSLQLKEHRQALAVAIGANSSSMDLDHMPDSDIEELILEQANKSNASSTAYSNTNSTPSGYGVDTTVVVAFKAAVVAVNKAEVQVSTLTQARDLCREDHLALVTRLERMGENMHQLMEPIDGNNSSGSSSKYDRTVGKARSGPEDSVATGVLDWEELAREVILKTYFFKCICSYIHFR